MKVVAPLLVGASAGAISTVAMSAVMLGAKRAGVTGELPPERITRRAIDAVSAEPLDDHNEEVIAAVAHLRVTGRPLVYACGGVSAEICAEAYRGAARNPIYGSGRVTYFKVVPVGTGPDETSTCNAIHVERGKFTFGIFGSHSIPLCG